MVFMDNLKYLVRLVQFMFLELLLSSSSIQVPIIYVSRLSFVNM